MDHSLTTRAQLPADLEERPEAEQPPVSEAKHGHRVTKTFRLTLFFVVTSLVVITGATLIVNRVIGDLAEANLMRIAEEDTARNAIHIQSMLRGGHSMNGPSSAGSPTDGKALQDMQQPTKLTLESAVRQLPDSFQGLVDGLNVVKFNLFDLNGNTVWSTDPATIGISKRESPFYGKAVAGVTSSKLVTDHDVVLLDGESRSLDVVETYMPLRDTPSGEIIGALELYRDIGNDVAIQVDDAESAVLWTTVATMGGLFLVLTGFIVVADVTIFRANRREMALVDHQLDERRRAEETLERKAEELSRSNDELEQFAYVASHDLQEPLRMVSSYTQLLAKRYQESLDEDAKEFIAYTVDGAARMQLLINDLLAYSRVGIRGNEPEATDCNAVFDVAVANLAAAIEENEASVTHDPLPTVHGDPIQLEQLFQNLIGNAMKYRGEDPPRVHVSAQFSNGEWLYSVRDNGIGIEPEYAERIFIIFQRLHTREAYPGTGIGLSICKKIVERHGGRIWVESEPGKGTTFYFTIPDERG